MFCLFFDLEQISTEAARCQHKSGILESWILLGQYAVQTNWAKVNYKSLFISASGQSMHRPSITLSSASINSLNQVGLLLQPNHPALSVSENEWSPGIVSALSGPRAAGHVMPWRWRCSLAVDHNLL